MKTGNETRRSVHVLHTAALILGCCLCLVATDTAIAPGVAAGRIRTHDVEQLGAVDPQSVPWDLPVQAEVIDYFRAPRTEWGPGNRGWEFASSPSDQVVAVGSGSVSFAGWVAGRGVVSIDHGDGLVSSVTGLSEVWVAGSASVTRGQPIGMAQRGLHLGFRLHGRYLDPALFYPRPRHAILVPIPSGTE